MVGYGPATHTHPATLIIGDPYVMLRKFLPLLLGGLTALFVLAAILPKPQATVIVAAYDLPAGHTLSTADLAERTLPQDAIPAQAITTATTLIGQTLGMARTAGDVITTDHLGQPVTLAPDERALALRVTDSTGLAGLLRPGQQVGVTAVLLDRAHSNAQAKVTVNGLRVLYLPPTFRAAAETDSEQDLSVGGANTLAAPQRREQGVVVVAVPVTPQAVVYEPPTNSQDLTAATRWVNPLELLTALNASPDAVLALFLEPENPAPFATTGLVLSELFQAPEFVKADVTAEGAGQ